MASAIQLERPCKNVVSLAIPTPFPIGDVNVYLLEGDTLTLVDTGPNTDEAWETLVRGMQAAGYRLSDIQQIVLTHFHEDHTGLASQLKERTGATILAHPATAVWLREEAWFVEGRNRFFTDVYVRAGLDGKQIQRVIGLYEGLRHFGCTVEVDEWLQEGQSLPGHPEWKVIYTPGHSQTHLSLYRSDDASMILADHLIAHISANAFLEPTVRLEGERIKTLVQYRQELIKLKDVPFRVGLSGHGVPILDSVSLIDRRLQSMERRGETIFHFLTGEIQASQPQRMAGLQQSDSLTQTDPMQKTAVEIAFHLFPHHQDQLPLILSETIGHLDWLEVEGKVKRVTREGVDWYSMGD